MAKFAKKEKRQPAISTASLPDIVFMLLFFFMVTTVLRQGDILVKQEMPSASQLQKIERKSLVSHIYIGKPKQTDRYGSEPRVQINDVLAQPLDIPRWVENEKADLPPADRDLIKISMKVDKDAKMGIVTDVEQQLRKAEARSILYSAVQSR